MYLLDLGGIGHPSILMWIEIQRPNDYYPNTFADLKFSNFTILALTKKNVLNTFWKGKNYTRPIWIRAPDLKIRSYLF